MKPFTLSLLLLSLGFFCLGCQQERSTEAPANGKSGEPATAALGTKLADPPDVVGRLIAILKAYEPSDVYHNAANDLVKIGQPAVGPLIACLNDRTPPAPGRGYAAEALGQLGDKRAVEPLIACLKDWGWDKDTICSVVGALGQLGDGRAVEPLIASLKAPDYDTICSVVGALGQLGDGRAVEPLIAYFKGGRNVSARSEAGRALVKIGEPAVAPLIACLKKGEDETFRSQAAMLLGMLGDERAVEPLIACAKGESRDLGPTAFYALVHMFRSNAGKGMGKAGQSAVGPLIVCLKKGEDESFRPKAAELLGEIGDARAVEPLIACVKEQDGSVGQSAVHALVKVGPPAVEPLIARLRGHDKDTIRYVAYALGQLGDECAVEPLISCLKESHENQEIISRALARIGGERTFDTLWKRWFEAKLSDEGSDPRLNNAFISCGVPMIPRFVNNLETLDRRHLAGAALVLEWLNRNHPNEVIPPLAATLFDGQGRLHWAQAWVMTSKFGFVSTDGQRAEPDDSPRNRMYRECERVFFTYRDTADFSSTKTVGKIPLPALLFYDADAKMQNEKKWRSFEYCPAGKENRTGAGGGSEINSVVYCRVSSTKVGRYIFWACGRCFCNLGGRLCCFMPLATDDWSCVIPLQPSV